MAGTESTVENNPFKHTSDVRKAEAQIRLCGYEYYVRAEILQSYMHAHVFIIYFDTILQHFSMICSCKKVRPGKTQTAQSHQSLHSCNYNPG